MAWLFNKGDNRKRRRMGQVARTSWQARWEKFFSGRAAPPSEVPPPSKARAPRPAKITAYDEPSASPRRGRSLPRWQRSAQARLWKLGRPIRSFHRRVPAAMLILLYLGLLGGLSAAFVAAVLLRNPPQIVPPVAAAPAEEVPQKKLTYQPEIPLSKAARSLTLRDGSERTVTEQMADIEFRAGNYAEAEKLYRQLFLKSEAKPLLGYRIYVCALLRENHTRAADLLPRLARIGAKTPAAPYARATEAFREGRKDEAAAILAETRAQFGDACAEYDETLRVLGYTP
jgi:hypothetical protein